MKKITAFSLAILMLLCLIPIGADAAYQSSKVAVTVAVPTPGTGYENVKASDVIASYTENGNTTLLEDSDFSNIQTTWKVKNGATMTASSQFEAGKEYEVTIEIFLGMNATFDFSTDTLVTVNGSQARGSKLNETITVKATFTVTQRDFSPKVSVSAEGQTEKTYDGKNVILSAALENKENGITYTYQWYKDKKVINETQEKFSVKNVTDSGAYSCTVTASDGKTEISSTSKEIPVKITPRSLTVNISNATKNLHEKDPEFSYMIVGEYFDTLQGALSREEGEGTGTYSIMIGTLAFSEENAANYNIIVNQGMLTIRKSDTVSYTAVNDIADLSRITGQNGAKIAVEASQGAIPDGAIVSLQTVSETENSSISALSDDTLLKSFAITLIDSNNKTVALNSDSSVKISVPLTEEEAKNASAIRVVYYNPATNTVTPQTVSVVVSKKATYLVFEVEHFSTYALLQAKDSAGVAAPEPEKDTPRSSTWIWVLSIVIVLLAAGGIVFSILWIRRRKDAPILPTENEIPPEEEALPSTILTRRAGKTLTLDDYAAPADEVYADQGNGLPGNGQQDGEEDDVEEIQGEFAGDKDDAAAPAPEDFSDEAPSELTEDSEEEMPEGEEPEELPKAPSPRKAEEKPGKPRIISFDDLEK